MTFIKASKGVNFGAPGLVLFKKNTIKYLEPPMIFGVWAFSFLPHQKKQCSIENAKSINFKILTVQFNAIMNYSIKQ